MTVYDETSKVVATGALDDGVFKGKTGDFGLCEYGISVEGVPDDAKFYQVEISHRGKITVTAEQAKAGAFGATLGS